MEPKLVLERRRHQPVTPYNHAIWESQLRAHNLIDIYPTLPAGLQSGFNINIPSICNTQSPPNSPSLITFRFAFETILARELTTGRYIGPFTHNNLLHLLGPFQSSPISIIPKPGKPGKFRVIQNFSFPLAPSTIYPNRSINSSVNSDDFPCTWGTFDTICTIIRSLPPGSQAATRDVAEAYRTIPLHASQWAAAVVRLPDGDFCIDTCVAFGMGPSAGAYGHIADAGVDLLRAAGLGPLAKWVDDHIFFRVRREHLLEYNAHRSAVHTLLDVEGRTQTGGRLWHKGKVFEDDSFEVYAEDCRFPLRDLSQSSLRADVDAAFAFAFADIDHASLPLGIPWEPTKDSVFAFVALYLGLVWNLIKLSVELSAAKKNKYSAAIAEWRSKPMHVLLEVQRLYGKLLHSCLVVPAGRAYLTTLETMLGICTNHPFMPHHSVRHLNDDLDWWQAKLAQSCVHRSITQPSSLIDIRAFSDASTSVGVAITLDGYWRAWTLRPGWSTLDGQRDIGWAESVGFELLVHAILNGREAHSSDHYRVFCDNQGIVNGWKNGRSRNWATNLVFRRIHEHLDAVGRGTSFHLSYVPSANNPADGPSRGIFPPRRFLLPPITLPGDLSKFLVDADLSAAPRTTPVVNQNSSSDELVVEADNWNWGDRLREFHDAWRD